MFELTFLTAGPTSQTLVAALYYAVFASSVRAVQSVDAMAVIYMASTLIWLVIALRFVNPTQMVTRAKAQPAKQRSVLIREQKQAGRALVSALRQKSSSATQARQCICIVSLQRRVEAAVTGPNGGVPLS